MNLLDTLGLSLPIVQAPMAGTATPELAAAVSNAGGLGSLGLGSSDAAGARAMIDALQGRTNRAFNVNLFAHQRDPKDPAAEVAWLDALTPTFARFGARPPVSLQPVYRSLAEDDAMLALLIERAPPVVSLHFGLLDAERTAALKGAGSLLFATVTSLEEARAARRAGIDVLVAQGIEAGGHRGIFDPAAPDDALGTLALTRLLVAKGDLPVIAAGGIMDGQGIRAVLDLGAVAAQLGTAFVVCPESNADAAYRAALASPAAEHTVMTSAISGRPARSIANSFTALGAEIALPTPGYPMTYDAGKALIAAAKAAGDTGYGAQWAGQGAPLARAMPAAELVATLAREMGGGT